METDVEYVLSYILRDSLDVFSVRDIFEKTKGRLKTVDKLGAVLEILVEHRFIRLRERPDNLQRGRPSAIYEVNPVLHSQYSQKSDGGGQKSIIANIAPEKPRTDVGRPVSVGAGAGIRVIQPDPSASVNDTIPNACTPKGGADKDTLITDNKEADGNGR